MKNSALIKNWQVKFILRQTGQFWSRKMKKMPGTKNSGIKIGIFDEKPAAFERSTPS